MIKAAPFALLLVLTAAASGVWAMNRRPSQAAPQDAQTQWRGSFCAVAKAGVLVAQSPEEWAALWRSIGQSAPDADLSKKFAVAVFLGSRPTGGYGVVFKDAVTQGGSTLVRYSEKKPRGMVFQAVTQPYAVRLYPKNGLPVKVEKNSAESQAKRP